MTIWANQATSVPPPQKKKTCTLNQLILLGNQNQAHALAAFIQRDTCGFVPDQMLDCSHAAFFCV